MKKLYKKIRLEMNEGRIPVKGSTRHEWKDSVKDLPSQEVPTEDLIGIYNKHYYEVMTNEGQILKFRIDVEKDNSLDCVTTEEAIETFIKERLTK